MTHMPRSTWLASAGRMARCKSGANRSSRYRRNFKRSSRRWPNMAQQQQATFSIWRGDPAGGKTVDYTADVSEGMVVLDAVHQIQATQANDLACRWNCKAGKCGSCSAEVNGVPRLMCMTRLDELDLDQKVTIEPMQAFPAIRDLVTDVSW